jgi:alpha-1,6-mannosyltransferase
MQAIPGRFLLLAAILESLYLILLALGDLRRYLVEAVLLLLLSGLFYIVSVYFLPGNRDGIKPLSDNSLPVFCLLVGILFRLTVWPLYPAFSDDVYRYRWEGQVQAHGGNPYQIRATDPSWAWMRDRTFASISAPDFKAAYGPLVELLERHTYRAVAAFTSDPVRQVFWFKAPAALFDLGILWILWRILERRRLPLENLLIYAWSPLPVMEIWCNGHNDPIALFFLCAALLLADGGRWAMAFVSLSMAVAAKFWPILLFPAFVGWKGWRPLRWYQWLVVFPVFGLFAWPYLSNLGENARFLSGFIGGWRNNDSLFAALLWLGGDPDTAKYLAAALIVSVSLAVMFLRLPLERAWLVVSASILMISANAHPWYLNWLMPPLVLAPFTPLLLWVALAPIAHHVILAWSTVGEWRGSGPLRWLIYVPVYGLLVGKGLMQVLRYSWRPFQRIRFETGAENSCGAPK